MELQWLLLRLMKGAATFGAGLLAAVLARWIAGSLARRLHADRSVAALATQGVFYTLLVLALITSLGTMGVNVSALVASLGLGGFALGFALRDAISNTLAGVLVLLYHPFVVGQRISVMGLEGQVAEINFRYTILRTEGMHQMVPNQLLFTKPVKVFEDAGPAGQP